MIERPQSRGRLAENILTFARTWRAAGLPVGPGKVLVALEAVQAIGLARRDDFYWTLHAVFVNRRDQKELFDQAFHIFWRNPRFLDRVMQLLLPQSTLARGPESPADGEINRRLAEALKLATSTGESPRPKSDDRLEVDAVMTFSSREVLRKTDFEKMSVAELEQAKRLIRTLRLPLDETATRRFRPDPAGRRADLRATMRAALRTGGNMIPLRWRARHRRPPPLVILCDISGSMSRYSRMLLHFLHAVTNDRDRVHSFLFGTRLTNVTRYLRYKDVDVALDRIADTVLDWSSGTRIGACLKAFNRNWARRVLGSGAVVLFISDGLDRDNAEGLEDQILWLRKSCRRLIWLNPLLRYPGYETKSLGARALVKHVDEMLSVHNLESLEQLGAALARPVPTEYSIRAKE